MNDIIYPELSYKIMGACFEVYRDKGCGFLEAVYQECLELELTDQGVPFAAQQKLQLGYKGRLLKQTYEPDFTCYGKIIIEIKAVAKLAYEHRAQMHNYLRASGLRLGLLINYGHYPKLESERIAL